MWSCRVPGGKDNGNHRIDGHGALLIRWTNSNREPYSPEWSRIHSARWGLLLIQPIMNREPSHLRCILAATLLGASACHGAEHRAVATAIEAERCAGVDPASVVEIGSGEKAAALTPGGPGLTADLDLDPGIYAVSLVARSLGGRAGVALITLEVREHGTGRVRSWTMPALYGNTFDPVGRMYFPAHAGGTYSVKAGLATVAAGVVFEKGSLERDPYLSFGERLPPQKFAFDPVTRSLVDAPASLLVDRLEILDALAGCPRKACKTRRMLTSDEELAKIRRDFAAGSSRLLMPEGDSLRRPLQGLGDRTARSDALWSRAPDFNELTGLEDPTCIDPHGWLLGGYRGRGFIAGCADAYEKTGDPEIAWDGAVALCALAEKYPGFYAPAQLVTGNLRSHPNRNWRVGHKFGDIFWLATAYDQLFDFIRNSQELADCVGGRIPWVRTPEDVVRLLDVHLLQAAAAANTRPGGRVGILLATVLGVCDVSERMLDDGMGVGFEGVLPCEFSFHGPIDDISFVSLYRTELWGVAPLLEAYRRAGGAPRHDLAWLHPGFSAQEEIERWERMHVSGGYRAMMPSYLNESRSPFTPGRPDRDRAGVSGHMNLFVTLTRSFPSRVMQDVHGTHVAMDTASLSILESGQFQDDRLDMRSAWVQYNALGLPLQGTAHGGLSLSHFNKHSHQDLGEAAPGSDRLPTTRTNIVETDARITPHRANSLKKPPGFGGQNVLALEGKEIPVGMSTCFAPLSGAQFMEHAQTPLENLSLYVRQTALIDAGAAESYVFDVVRVRGGTEHAYCLSAFPGTFASNVKLNPVAVKDNPDLPPRLRGYADALRSDGANPSVIQADWTMDPILQKGQQEQRYDAALPVTTRLSLLGRQRDLVLAGCWRTVRPELEYWNLIVQGQQASAGRESVFPGIIETFAGRPFLAGKRPLAVGPPQSGAEAAVGVEVRTVDGRTDWLHASLMPQQAVTLEGTVRVSGRFALVSRDAAGVRKLALVGGTELRGADFLLRTDRAIHDLEVDRADCDRRSFAVVAALEPEAWRGGHVRFAADGRTHPFHVTDVQPEGGKTVLRCDRPFKIFQSNLTGVDEEEGVVFTAIPPFTVRPGMTITNEKQDRHWRVLEISSRADRPCLKLGGVVRRADFTDANGDGKVKVGGLVFGPGDRMLADAMASVERTAAGLYLVEANVGCTVGLPTAEHVQAELSVDGRTFTAIAAQAEGGLLMVRLADKDLAQGKAWIRLGAESR